MFKFLLPLSLLLVSSIAIAQSPATVSDVVQLQGPYNATIEQVQESVVNMYLPDDGVAVIDLIGQDRFVSYTINTLHFEVFIKSSGKTVAIKNNLPDGSTQSLALETLCGRSVSVNIISISSKATPDMIKPKLLISAPSC